MKVLVPVKRVIDAYVKIRVKRDETGVETQNVKMSMNPFCEIAMEQAVRLKESGEADEVIALTIGPQSSQDVLRTALAMGADRAIHVRQDDGDVQPLAVAKLLKAVVEQEDPGLVLMGKQAIDGDHNQTGQMLAAMLGWPQATFISKLEHSDDSVQITREIDGGLQTLKMKKPAVLTVDLRLNEPRYPSLPNIMKAKKKPLEEKTPEDFRVDTSPRYDVLKVTEPPERVAGVKVETVDELVDKLKNEAKVI
mgnify:CR=1 FL=1